MEDGDGGGNKTKKRSHSFTVELEVCYYAILFHSGCAKHQKILGEVVSHRDDSHIFCVISRGFLGEVQINCSHIYNIVSYHTSQNLPHSSTELENLSAVE